MSDAGQPSASGDQAHWVVELDEGLCSLCECCARDCPSGALRAQKDGERLTLSFQSSLCDACALGEGCEATCPEDALTRRDGGAEGGSTERIQLVDGELVHCTYCNAAFGTVRKLDRVAQKKTRSAEIVRDLCPLCRRKHLVVRFIDEERMPEGKAEYRSTYDILRRAGKLIPGEKPR
jgi:MinD superfamily P-loop ATPase